MLDLLIGSVEFEARFFQLYSNFAFEDFFVYYQEISVRMFHPKIYEEMCFLPYFSVGMQYIGAILPQSSFITFIHLYSHLFTII